VALLSCLLLIRSKADFRRHRLPIVMLALALLYSLTSTSDVAAWSSSPDRTFNDLAQAPGTRPGAAGHEAV